VGISAEDAADILQEVFGAVVGGIAGFRHAGPQDTFRGWLRTIARNKIRDHFRDKAGRAEAIGGTDAQQRFMEVSAETPETAAAARPLDELFRQALLLIQGEFEHRTWEAFWQVVAEDRSPDDVAQRLGMTPGAVRQAKYKVLRRLRQELGDSG
jgi:RNA polymerase sigma-70 factor (ECF subfamily)